MVHRCAGLTAKYAPARWVGDNQNGAADRFVQELNARQAPPVDASEVRPRFYPCGSALLEMEMPYAYILPTLKNLLDKDRRRLFLKDSRIVQCLGEIKGDELHFMEWGEYPAIEALGATIHELGYWRPPPPQRPYNQRRGRFRKVSL